MSATKTIVHQKIKYKHNTWVIGINTPNSYHCVSERHETKFPRFFANLYTETHNLIY